MDESWIIAAVLSGLETVLFIEGTELHLNEENTGQLYNNHVAFAPHPPECGDDGKLRLGSLSGLQRPRVSGLKTCKHTYGTAAISIYIPPLLSLHFSELYVLYSPHPPDSPLFLLQLLASCLTTSAASVRSASF